MVRLLALLAGCSAVLGCSAFRPDGPQTGLDSDSAVVGADTDGDSGGLGNVVVETDPADTDDPADSGLGAETDFTETDAVDTDIEPFSYAGCTGVPAYTRVTHSVGDNDFVRASFAPDGTYALILGYPGQLVRYEADSGLVAEIAEPSNARLDVVRFAEDGSYALIGGFSTATNPAPLLYRYTESNGLEAVSTSGGPFSESRIRDLQQRPGTSEWLVLSDDGNDTGFGIAFTHLLDPDFTGGAHTWTYYGGVTIQQGASSIAWGTNLGSEIALGTSRYLELLYLDPALSSNKFSLQSHGNTGNLKKVVFNSTRDVAWVLQWSGSGEVYPWQGTLDTDDADSFSFTGHAMWDFATSPDGTWKVFVGRFGNVWWSDSSWTPIQKSKFYNYPIPAFDSSPWSGDSNTYLHEAAWRPGRCEGIFVGDATSSKGIIVRFTKVP